MSMLRYIDVYRNREQQDVPRNIEMNMAFEEILFICITSSSCRRNVRFSLLAHSMFS